MRSRFDPKNPFSNNQIVSSGVTSTTSAEPLQRAIQSHIPVLKSQGQNNRDKEALNRKLLGSTNRVPYSIRRFTFY